MKDEKNTKNVVDVDVFLRVVTFLHMYLPAYLFS